MFVLRKSGIVAAFSALVTSTLAQNHSSEQSEAQITGMNHPIVPTLSPYLTPIRHYDRSDHRMHTVYLCAHSPVHSELPAYMAAR